MRIGWEWSSFTIYMLLMLYFHYTLKKTCYKSEFNYFENTVIPKKREIYLFFSIVPIIFAVYRKVDISIGLGGSDLDVYFSMFNDEKQLLGQVSKGFALLSRNNPLFYCILYVIRRVTSDYHIMFLVIYSVVTITTYYYLKEQYKYINTYAPLYYVLFYFLRSFSLLKFMLGLSFIMIGFVMMSKKKRFWAILMTVIGTLIHSSLALGLCCIMVWIICEKGFFKNRKRIMIFIILSYFVLFIMGNYFRNIISAGEMNSYLNTELTWINSNLTTILCGFFCLLFFKDIKNKPGYNPFILFLVIFDVACIPIQNMLGFFRLHYIFILPRLCAWGYIFDVLNNKIKIKEKQFIYIIANLLVISWTIFRFIKTYEAANLMPYIFDF